MVESEVLKAEAAGQCLEKGDASFGCPYFVG